MSEPSSSAPSDQRRLEHPPPDQREVLTALAALQARKYARHPVFLVGVLAVLAGLVQGLVDGFGGEESDSWEGILTYPLWIGLPGVVVGYRLAVTEHKALAVLPSAPTDQRTRTLALYLACLVPATACVLLMAATGVATLVMGEQAGSFVLRPSTGEIGWVGYVAYLLEIVVACFGGPALGVTVGRWVRFPGAGVLVALALFLVELTAMGMGEGTYWQELWARSLNNAMPYVYWKASPDVERVYTAMRPGSAVGHLVYALALCGLAVTAGVLKNASPSVRATWRRRGWLFVGLAVVGYLWAVFG